MADPNVIRIRSTPPAGTPNSRPSGSCVTSSLVGATSRVAPTRVAVMLPSLVHVYPLSAVPRFSGVPLPPLVFAGAFGSEYGITSATAYAVTVPATVPVWISSQ